MNEDKPLDLKPHPIVAKLVTHPDAPPEVVQLLGYLGNSSREGFIRVYGSLDFDEFTDVPRDAILHAEDVPATEIEHGGTRLWIKAEAQVVREVRSVVRKEARFLEGAIAEAHLAKLGQPTEEEWAAQPEVFGAPVTTACPTPETRVCPSEPPMCPKTEFCSAYKTCPNRCPVTVLPSCPKTCAASCAVTCPPKQTCARTCPTCNKRMSVCPPSCAATCGATCPRTDCATCPRTDCPPCTRKSLCPPCGPRTNDCGMGPVPPEDEAGGSSQGSGEAQTGMTYGAAYDEYGAPGGYGRPPWWYRYGPPPWWYGG